MPDDFDPAGPRSPELTKAAAKQMAELAHYLNLATRDDADGIEDPRDVDLLLGDVTTTLDRLPQLLDQVRHFLHVRAFTGRVGHDQGHDAARSVQAAERALNRASGHLIHAAEALREATSETSHLTGLGLQEREDDGSAWR